MIFKELLLKFKSDNVLKRLVKLYPNQKKNLLGYAKAIKELTILKPHTEKMQILIEKGYNIFDKKYYCHVCAIDKNKQTYAIEFEPWNNWLGMEIHIDSLKNYTELDIICHCLYEMTFTGFSNKEVKNEKDKLLGLLKKVYKKEKKQWN